MKKIVLLLFIFTLFCSCGKSEKDPGAPPLPGGETLTEQQKEGQALAEMLWTTTPLQSQPWAEERSGVLERLQTLADKCSSVYFDNYLKGIDQTAENQEKHDVLLSYYRYAFDKVLDGIRNEKVENGTACIWMLYNMGYVVKTPSGCFGIDIMHRWAEKLVPYLDFLCITHNHQDHYDVTVFCINCGNDSGNFTLMHTGDSNYKTAQYTNILGRVNVLIPRYAPNALTENNIIGEKNEQTSPDYVLLSHILELTHASVEKSRWSLPMALERASKINCKQTYVPMWGEKLVWKNGKLN